MKYSDLFGPVFADIILLVEKFESKKSQRAKLPGFFSVCRYV